jgi:hypothetical protein
VRVTQLLDFVILRPERRYIEVERLDDLEAFLAIIEKGSQAAASRFFAERYRQTPTDCACHCDRSEGTSIPATGRSNTRVTMLYAWQTSDAPTKLNW